MSNLTDLVPPLELCKLIPAGEFQDSALMCEATLGMASRQVLNIRIIPRQKITNNPYVDRKLGREYYIYPAPTLQEIMEAIGGIKKDFIQDPFNEKRMIKRNPRYQPSIEFFPGDRLSWRSMRWTNSMWSEHDTTAPAAALRTFLKIKDVTVTMPCAECGTWLQHLDDDQAQEECFDDIRVSVTEVCPKCGYKYYDGLFLHIYTDINKHLTFVNTPMGSRWIKKLSDPSAPTESEVNNG